MSRAAEATIVYWRAAISAKSTTMPMTVKMRRREAPSSRAIGGSGSGDATSGTWAWVTGRLLAE